MASSTRCTVVSFVVIVALGGNTILNSFAKNVLFTRACTIQFVYSIFKTYLRTFLKLRINVSGNIANITKCVKC